MLARSSRRARNQPRREEVSVRSAPAGPDKGRIDHIAALVLCGLAALRIFFFSAAFPLCNNVDEDDHFDLVFKYSHGYLPRAASERYSPDSADLIALYWSPEYLNPLEAFPDRTYPPPWWQRRGVAESREFNRNLAAWRNMNDYQVASFPLYYFLAGWWLAAGRAIGISGGYLLYWVRFLDVPLYAMLVLLSHLITFKLFPGSRLHRVGLPFLVAFFPQDAFYSVTPDALTPLVFTLALYAMIRVWPDDAGLAVHVLAGLAIAATLLTRLSNLPVLIPAGIVLLLKARKALRSSDCLTPLFRLAALSAAAALPVGAWVARNILVLGDLTGTAGKVALLGWTVKPLARWLPHPILTPGGFTYFVKALVLSFWRGELVWDTHALHSGAADLFYLTTTGLFMIACVASLLVERRRGPDRERLVVGMSLGVFAMSALFLAVISIPYDYGNCLYPSRNLPFIASGRLIGGALLPFLIAYLYGLTRLLSWTGIRVNPLHVVTVVVVVATVSEVLLTGPVFGSAYNWFHLF